MSSWRDHLRPASFRGVPFQVQSQRFDPRRRVQQTRLTGRDGSIVRDLGRDPDDIDVTAYLVGEDVISQRDALEAALLTPGPGDLVLPFRPSRSVTITKGPSTTENLGERGYVQVVFSAIAQPTASAPTSRVNPASQLDSAATDVVAAAEADFLADFDVSELPQAYRDSARAAIASVTTAMRKAIGKISKGLSVIDEITAEIDTFSDTADALITTPAALASSLLDLVASTMSVGRDAFAAVDRITGLPDLGADALERARRTRVLVQGGLSITTLGDDEPVVSQVNARGILEARNQQAIFRLVRAAGLAELARQVPVLFFDSYDAASSIRGDLLEAFDVVRDQAADREYAALGQLWAETHRYLSVVAATLPEIQRYTPQVSMPALLIAHQVWGDATRLEELLLRNNVPNPLLVDPGTSLEVVDARG